MGFVVDFKVPSNVSDGHCEPFQAHDVNHKDTKRKRTSMIKRKLFIISSLLILEVYFFAYLPYVVSFSASESSVVKPIQGKENVNSKRSISASRLFHVFCESLCQSSRPLLVLFGCRRVSGVIDTTVIPEVTCQTEEDAEKGFVSQGTNQIADNIVSNKFVLDAANPVKDGVNSKRFLYSLQLLHFF